jgi:hypothetical protein
MKNGNINQNQQTNGGLNIILEVKNGFIMNK